MTEASEAGQGQQEAQTYTCPTCRGESDALWAEEHWTDVNGDLCCSVYCAAIHDGKSEEEAQQARGEHTEEVGGELREQRISEARQILEAEGIGQSSQEQT